MPLVNWKRRPLRCFYCGFKTSTVFDGKLRRFDCPSCEAPNYLDESGEIADPPVATETIATPTRFAVPLASSPPTSPSDSVFCKTCIKNQQLLRSTLAQYLPEPDDPEYEEYEQNFYKFRNNQEKLYPQICADCEPKVRDRLQQAAYTAKADVLRRMVDRSAAMRQQGGTRRTWLDTLNTVGWWLWTAALLIQMAWHASILQRVALDYLLPKREDPSYSLHIILLNTSRAILAYLPSEEWLRRLSMYASIGCVWWNPRWVQVYRGFTKHIRGLSKWYIFQFMAIAGRYFLPWLPEYSASDPPRFNMLVAGHIIAAGFAILIYVLGPRSIRVDMVPLFGFSPQNVQHPTAAPPSKKRPPSSSPQKDDIKSMAELLDEISHTPSPAVQSQPQQPPSPTIPDDFPLSSPSVRKRPQMGFTHIAARQPEDIHIDSLNLSPAPAPESEEMDWSPIESPTSKYRAFNTFGQRDSKFGEAPVEEPKGAFWYKVPRAPTTPLAERIKLPNPPFLRKSPIDERPQQTQFSFRGKAGKPSTQLIRRPEGDAQEERPRQVPFAEPSFFARRPDNDPRNSLVEMFGEALALTPDEQQEQARAQQSGWLGRLIGGTGGSPGKKNK
ncbi:Ima1 N-terminal domain-containing protein [Podospora didyma]|uniref:Ima1 N-terminal domain-containing protein n=1 Tax=Podospora didyma TaxID=330526 RepID=A0AAE0U1F8_9PEZI|nr:Ima1 N-terminal domain-containing protein [Podospora didyma]